METQTEERMRERSAQFAVENPEYVRENPVVTTYTQDPSGNILNTTAFKTAAERDAFMKEKDITQYLK